MKKINKFLISLSVFLILISPTISLAAGLVPCDTGDSCDFNAFMKLVNGVITFLLFDLALPLAGIMFAYAGILLVTSGGSPESRTKAKSIFFNAVIGLVLAAAAWVIVNTLLSILGYDGAWLSFFKIT